MDSDSDDEREEFKSYLGVPATIVLINVFDPHKTETPTRSYESTCRLIRQYLRHDSNHYIGVCVFGTEETGTSNFASQNIKEIVPLNLPNLSDYKKIQEANIPALEQAKEFNMSDALWHCSKMFASCKKQLLSRTILMLTRFDTPPKDHNPTFKRVEELVESNIAIKLLNIAERDYEPNEFYKNLLINICKSKDVTLPKPIWDTDVIEENMYQQSHRHLANAQLYFEIGDGFEIGVGVYNLLKSKTNNKSEYLERDTNALLTGLNKTHKVSIAGQSTNIPMEQDEFRNSSQIPVLKSETAYSVDYGREQIVFTNEEKKKIMNPFGPPKLKLLGFITAADISMQSMYFKRGYFLYPNKKIMEGSTVAFKALHTACIEKSVVAICVLSTRVNSKPYIVALSPCVQPLNLNINIGFDVILLPFHEHFRQLTVEEGSSTYTPVKHKEFLKKILEQLKFDYKPQLFEDPKANSKYRAIEAIALQVEQMDPYVDTTKPDPKTFEKVESECELFEEIFGPFGAAPKRSGVSNNSTSKKPRIDCDIDETELKMRVQKEQVHLYNVQQLKEILKSKSIPDLPNIKALKKQQLVDLVYTYFSE